MRKEYTISSIVNDFIAVFNDFASGISDFPYSIDGDWQTFSSLYGYPLNSTRKVLPMSFYVEGKYNVKIRAIQNASYIGFQVYNNGVNLPDVKDITAGNCVIVSDLVSANRSDFYYSGGYDALQYYQNFAYYFPMPIICDVGTKLVLNYNEEDYTLMISSIIPIQHNYYGFTYTSYDTFNVCFGTLIPYGTWMEGNSETKNWGFWYGGDAVASLEWYMRAQILSPSPDDSHVYGVCSGEESTRLTSHRSYFNHSQFGYAGMRWCFDTESENRLDEHIRKPVCGGSDYKSWYDSPMTISQAGYASYKLPNTANKFRRFEAFLRIDMDCYPLRAIKATKYVDSFWSHGDIDSIYRYCGNLNFYVRPYRVHNDCNGSYTDHVICSQPVPQLNHNDNGEWATTLDLKKYNYGFNGLSWFIPMVVSIDNKEKGLPSYWSLFTDDKFSRGHTVNTLNKISTVYRLYFMVHRDPKEIESYSCVGYTDTINYVNMAYMTTNSVLNGTYPTKTGYYNCFQTGIRRSDQGFKGYAGLAFKIDDPIEE